MRTRRDNSAEEPEDSIIDVAQNAARPVAHATPRVRKYGIPPPAKFDFDGLPASSWLTTEETAAVLRRAVNTVAMWRQDSSHPLRWARIDGKPLYQVGWLRTYMAGGARGRRTDSRADPPVRDEHAESAECPPASLRPGARSAMPLLTPPRSPRARRRG